MGRPFARAAPALPPPRRNHLCGPCRGRPIGRKERLIEVTPDVRQSVVDVFKLKHEGREPTADELAPIIDGWILNEITYREALAQGLDKGDEMIRERIMQKMRLLIFGSLNVDSPTDAELRP